tara:strand:- start:143 stop:295 length:153 start_codon:yes stop_codon:yes gene_type:complete
MDAVWVNLADIHGLKHVLLKNGREGKEEEREIKIEGEYIDVSCSDVCFPP